MVRRPRGDADDVSLFPFLSILACIIGVLTLLFSAMALAQMDNDTVVLAEQYEKIRQALEACQKEVAELRLRVDQEDIQAVEEIDQKRQQVAEAQLRLNELLQQLEQVQIAAGGPKSKISVPDYDAVIQREALEQMESQAAGLREQIAQLEKELEDRGKPPVESEVSILPGGTGLGFDPVFVECAAGSIVIHASDPPQRIRQADMATEEAFIDLLDRVAESDRQTVIFLVRNDGLSSYQTARSLADAHATRHGKLPVIGQGRLNLNYFHNR
jgi:hypothetical protein